MALNTISIFNRRGHLLGWWFGEVFHLPGNIAVNLIGNLPKPGPPSRGAVEATIKNFELRIATVELMTQDGTHATRRFAILEPSMAKELWEQPEAIKFTGRFQ